MGSEDPASPKNEIESHQDPPLVESLQDLNIVESFTSEGKLKSTAFYHITEDDEVYFGKTLKNKREMTIAEFNSSLQRVRDQDIYPEVPADTHFTLAPATLNASSIYVKRSGLQWYEEMAGTNYLPKAVLDETIIMEQISKSPHPNIIRYHGCRLRRGYITSIVLERLDRTLDDYVSTSLAEFQRLDKVEFFESVKSAVDYLHTLGLAHNDINPQNIMLRNGEPVLIDFDSCQPFGKRLQSLGTEGWYEKPFFTSEKEHDVYSLGKLQQWIQTAGDSGAE
ncbi:kinase-like domain-containing protein [Aspergillus varians]